MMTLGIWQNIENFFGNIKEFFIEHGNNPLLWLGIFLLGLLVFELVFQALNKDR